MPRRIPGQARPVGGICHDGACVLRQRRRDAATFSACTALAPFAVQQDGRHARQVLQAEAPHLIEGDLALALAATRCRAKELRDAPRKTENRVCGLRQARRNHK
jgi:hypothetical protein